MRKLLLVYLLTGIFSCAFAGDWQVDSKAKNSIVFNSSTTLLDFEGKTENIDGYIYWEGEKVFGEKNELYFEVQLNTFDTGNGKRDRDMRNDVLHTKSYPVVSFKGNFIKVENSGSHYKVIVKGQMDLHGKKQEMEIPGTIEMMESKMNLKSSFSIFLKDYNIEAPSLAAFIKVAEEIKLDLDFNLKKLENE
ncbi:MAG: YceI family protein [Calditrichaeota bacterium]|nr:MAG: YceI family protein [Calditrichota bacterium]MBL1207783.1 YceI family protein [Calditrichota bacterium]NOG47616.1 YceI family protein [Calditrichota bacterium]